MLRKRGYRVGFGEFMKIGIPFTAAAVPAACAFVWLIWAR
jgi:Na+/H+ antiporter NhaD/arsenite permease-like protein